MSSRAERLFYRALSDPARSPEEIVERLVRLTRAELGYLEVVDCSLRAGYGHRQSTLDEVRAAVSTHLFERALIGGQRVVTESASHDARFQDLDSVRARHVRAVVCLPLAAVSGALYLHRDEPFSSSALGQALLAARRLGERCMLQQLAVSSTGLVEATRMFQRCYVLAALERANWSVTEAARALGIARSYLHKLISVHGLRRFEDLYRSVS